MGQVTKRGRQLANDEIRRIQLSILDYIDQFCKEKNIKYTLSYGTLIGAVRHKGFIPWDDDIDIAMTRENYERFLKLFNDSSGRYTLLEPRTSKKYQYILGKVVDNTTELIEMGYDNIPIGVFVDVFALDYVADSVKERQREILLRRLICTIRTRKFFPLTYGHSLSSSLLSLLCKMIPVTTSALFRLHHHLFAKHKKTNTLFNMCETGTPDARKQIIPAKCFEKYCSMEFEGKYYSVCEGYDIFLRNQFGDYMQLPPENERHPHEMEAYMKQT